MSQGSDPAACEVAGTASTPRQARATAATAATSLPAWRKRLTALISEHPSCASVRNSWDWCLMPRMFFTSVHVNTQSFAHLHRTSRTPVVRAHRMKRRLPAEGDALGGQPPLPRREAIAGPTDEVTRPFEMT